MPANITTPLGSSNIVDAAWQGYVTLLRLPPAIRIKYDNVLAEMRDSIAEAIEETPENVQNNAEAVVMIMGGLI